MSTDFTPTSSPMEAWFYRFWFRLLKDQATDQYSLERQYQIGPYYTDFIHLATRTVIEVDGKDYHYDLRRQAYLRISGLHGHSVYWLSGS